MQVLTKTTGMTYEEWKESRRKGIGGSDAAAILGLNKYKNPLVVYLEKIGEAPEIEDNEAMYWGRTLEDVVAREFAKQTGKKVQKCNKILIHPEHEFMIANIDRKIVGENAILECKTASAYKAAEWKGDEIPQEYIIQVVHYLAVTGAEKGYIAVLLGGNKFLWKEIVRDEETEKLIETLIERETEFWKCVEDRTAPMIDGSEAATELLKSLYPESNGSEMELPGFFEEKIQQREIIQNQINELKTQIDEIDNQIKNEMKESEVAKTGMYFIKWSNGTRKNFDSKKFEKDNPDLYKKYIIKTSYRTFKITPKKGDE